MSSYRIHYHAGLPPSIPIWKVISSFLKRFCDLSGLFVALCQNGIWTSFISGVDGPPFQFELHYSVRPRLNIKTIRPYQLDCSSRSYALIIQSYPIGSIVPRDIYGSGLSRDSPQSVECPATSRRRSRESRLDEPPCRITSPV